MCECTSATCSGVEWQLSRRTPVKYVAVISVYFCMCAHRYGQSSGLLPYRSFTLSPQQISSRLMYTLEPEIKQKSSFQTTRGKVLSMTMLKVVCYSKNVQIKIIKTLAPCSFDHRHSVTKRNKSNSSLFVGGVKWLANSDVCIGFT